MDRTIQPGKLRGTIAAQPSKYASHRALICAALAKGGSVLHNLADNEDTKATIGVLQAMGASFSPLDRGELLVKGIAPTREPVVLDCGESGSTLRFLLPVAAALGISATFTGRGRLPQRPIGDLADALAAHGVQVGTPQSEGEILSVSGQLQSGAFTLPGNVSSQYITGLLFALPLLPGDSDILLTTPLESSGYVDMTLEMQSSFGIRIERGENCFHIPGGQCYTPAEVTVEGDYSAAAFWLAAGAIGSDITVTGLREESLQADRAILEVLRLFGASLERREGGCRISSGHLGGMHLDVSDMPDLLPILAVVAACAYGTTGFVNAGRLRDKESDRIHATAQGLSALGARVDEGPDSLIVYGSTPLIGGVVDGFGDHRIAMAMSIAALNASEPVTIRGAECVNKSYPTFYDDLELLGGVSNVL
ncbi:MAG: 3-phosphoshikimate 1-carboxyvinyltransferase [Oscillospiraceae bacterium]